MQEFNSLEELFAALESSRESAKSRTLPMQWELADGREHYYYTNYYDLDVVGHIAPLADTLGIERRYYPENLQGEDLYEFEAIEYRLNENLKQGFVRVRAYSKIEPHGELGSEHVSSMIEINKEIFDALLESFQER